MDIKRVGEICKELTSKSLKIAEIWREKPKEMQQMIESFPKMSEELISKTNSQKSSQSVKENSLEFVKSIVDLLNLIKERPKIENYQDDENIHLASDSVGLKMTDLFKSFGDLSGNSEQDSHVKLEEDHLAGNFYFSFLF